MLGRKFARLSAVLLLIGLSLVVGCASGPPSLEQNIQGEISRGWVTVDVRDNGTVVLSGWVEDFLTKQNAANVARRGEGVTRVVNLIRVRD